jgi:hypothetical protein
MARRRRARATQLDPEWTAPLRWSDLPVELRDELRAQLRELLEQGARAAGAQEGGPDEE